MARLEGDDEIAVRIGFDGHLTRIELTEILEAIDSETMNALLDARVLPEGLFGRPGSPFVNPWEFLFPSVGRIYSLPVLPGWAPGSSNGADVPAFFAIRSFKPGSAILVGVLSVTASAIARRAWKKFSEGFSESDLPHQMKEFGTISGDLLATVISRLNRWAIRYVALQRSKQGNVTAITIETTAPATKTASEPAAKKRPARKTLQKKPPDAKA